MKNSLSFLKNVSYNYFVKTKYKPLVERCTEGRENPNRFYTVHLSTGGFCLPSHLTAFAGLGQALDRTIRAVLKKAIAFYQYGLTYRLNSKNVKPCINRWHPVGNICSQAVSRGMFPGTKRKLDEGTHRTLTRFIFVLLSTLLSATGGVRQGLGIYRPLLVIRWVIK